MQEDTFITEETNSAQAGAQSSGQTGDQNSDNGQTTSGQTSASNKNAGDANSQSSSGQSDDSSNNGNSGSLTTNDIELLQKELEEKAKAELRQYLEKGLASGAGRPAFVVLKELRKKYESSKTRI